MKIEDVDLSTCDTEPIHIPGRIQPHGALLATNPKGLIQHASSNAAVLLEVSDPIGRPIGEILPSLPDLDYEQDGPREIAALEHLGSSWDVTRHTSGARTIYELEPTEGNSEPTRLPMSALRKLQTARDIPSVSDWLVTEIEAITSFDRVMVYRFRGDLSGEVIAEKTSTDHGSYLNLRYPASDIPSQARRLYKQNLIRTIADTKTEAVSIDPPAGPDSPNPLDLSHAVLRAVSPIHIEYLRNMGVRASMSVSIVVDEKLWGLVACHHYESPKQVSRQTRSLCELLTQNASLMIEALLHQEESSEKRRTLELTSRILASVEREEDILAGLTIEGDQLLELTGSSGAAVSLDGRIHTVGESPPQNVVRKLIDELDGRTEESFASHAAPEVFEFLSDHVATSAGVMAVRFHPKAAGWILWFRGEVIKDVRWAGNPFEKVTVGEHGERLTPRGSFEVYTETVSNRSEPWPASSLHAVKELRNSLSEIALERSTQALRMREMVMAMVGHDLRNPLNAIGMAASMMDSDQDEEIDLKGTINASSKRMKRLVDLMLDMSRIESGQGLRMEKTHFDVKELLQRIVDEAKLAFPGVEYHLDLEGDGTVRADPDRIEQVVANLLSNARHHGTPGGVIDARFDGSSADHVTLEVSNPGDPIPEELQRDLFKAFVSSQEGKKSGGLGLGLHIAKLVVDGHGGTIDVESNVEATTFTVTLPRDPEESVAQV